MLTSTKDALARIIPGADSSAIAAIPAAALDIPIPDVVALGAQIDTLDRAHTTTGGPGAALRMARTAADDFRNEFAATGVAAYVSTHDLITLPYPTKFGLWRALASPVPFLFITNRLIVVRWTDSDGQHRTMLWEPSDTELDAKYPLLFGVGAEDARPPSRADGDDTRHLRA